MSRIKNSVAFARPIFGILFVIFFVMSLSREAQSNWIFESGLGYRSGSYEFTSTAKGTNSAVGFDGRILYSTGLAFFGLDTGYWMGTSTPSAGSAMASSGILVGPTMGVGFHRIRFWVSYFIVDYYIHQNPSFGEIRYAGGGGFKLGLGYEIMRMVSLNFDFLTHTYKRQEIRDLEATIDLNPTLKFTEYVLSLTIPFSDSYETVKGRRGGYR